MRFVRSCWIDPHPMPGRPRELDHLRGRVPPHQIVLESNGILLVLERAYLHAPPAAGDCCRTGARARAPGCPVGVVPPPGVRASPRPSPTPMLYNPAPFAAATERSIIRPRTKGP